MTIGFLLNTCEPFYRGGYERRAGSFARELARQGHDVRIYTSCPRSELIDGVRFLPLAPPRRFFNARGVRNGSADLLFALATLRLAGLVRRGELDVLDVCATPFVHLPFVALMARWKRAPSVLTCHEALLAELPEYVRERGNTRGGVKAALLARGLAAAYRLGMGFFPNRLAVSRRTASALKMENFPARETVEFGLEPEAIGPAPQLRAAGAPVRLISCGRLTPIKSVDRVLAALLSLRGASAAFHFDIIGEGSERARLEEMVAAAGAREVVRFHGEISEAAKRECLARADVFVLGSPREGFSIATLEAMAQGCAALVVSNPARPNGVLDFVTDGQAGLVVGPGDGAMREGLRRLIEDRGERERCRAAAWRKAREYRIEAQAAQLVKVYERARGAR
jgi:glycosyltransferase involved in cell wall biosynthesis